MHRVAVITLSVLAAQGLAGPAFAINGHPAVEQRAVPVPGRLNMPALSRPMQRPSVPSQFSTPLQSAPEIDVVLVDFQTPEKLQVRRTKEAGNYNSVKSGERSKGWGTTASSNGRRIENIYGNVAIPTVGGRSQDVGDVLKTPTYGQSFYKPGPQEALFGNDKYETLKNNLRPYVKEAIDQENALAGKGYVGGAEGQTPKMLSAVFSPTGSPAAALIGLLTGAGVTFAAFGLRRKRTAVEEPLMTVL